MHPITNIAIQAARKAGDIVVRYYERLESHQISAKGPGDFVTEIDKISEREIIEIIHKAYPDHAILGEEGGRQGKEDAEYTWIIDPIDGTVNYIRGLPFFCVSIGVQHNGVLEHGVIYDPIHQELFYATRGEGAYLNSHRIRVSKRANLKDAMLLTGIPHRHRECLDQCTKFINAIYGKIAEIRNFSSTALHLCYVACGRVDGCWVFHGKPWDIAAGILIVREAGGLVSDFLGEEKYMENGCLVAGTPKVFKELLRSFRPLCEAGRL